MKYYLAILILICFPVQAYYYAKIGLGVNKVLFSEYQEWEDNGSIGGTFGIGNRHHLSGNWYGEISYQHYSQPFVGPPFQKDEGEDSLDAFYYSIEYRFGE